jgi:hypothetical protein
MMTPADQRRWAPPWDAELVIYRLEEAGATLLALPGGRASGRLPSAMPDVVHNPAEAYAWSDVKLRPAVPGAARIDRMDEALRWVSLIDQNRYVLRRIVGARSLVSPLTERHLFSWRRIANMIGADHKAVQRWHAEGIDLIVRRLNAMSEKKVDNAPEKGDSRIHAGASRVG